jgi:hypothetical protein
MNASEDESLTMDDTDKHGWGACVIFGMSLFFPFAPDGVFVVGMQIVEFRA